MSSIRCTNAVRQKIALVIAGLAQAFPTRVVRSLTDDPAQAVFAIEHPDQPQQSFVIASMRMLEQASEAMVSECLSRAIALLRDGHRQVLLGESPARPSNCLPG